MFDSSARSSWDSPLALRASRIRSPKSCSEVGFFNPASLNQIPNLRPVTIVMIFFLHFFLKNSKLSSSAAQMQTQATNWFRAGDKTLRLEVTERRKGWQDEKTRIGRKRASWLSGIKVETPRHSMLTKKREILKKLTARMERELQNLASFNS